MQLMGRQMNTKALTTLLGLAIVAIPAVAPASQPAVRLADLDPRAEAVVSAADLALLFADPAAAQELSVVLPDGFTVLDPAAHPFGR